MENIGLTAPRIRREKNFVVEENVDAVRWPQECESCGGPVDIQDSIKLKENFKGFGEVHITIDGVPYCSSCYPKIQAGKRVNRIHWTLTFILGVPLGILLIIWAMATPNVNVIFCGVLLLLGMAMGYGLAWLFVKLPAKIMLKGKYVEPVDAWLIREKKRDGKEGISVVISIPNRSYAQKFQALNTMSA